MIEGSAYIALNHWQIGTVVFKVIVLENLLQKLFI